MVSSGATPSNPSGGGSSSSNWLRPGPAEVWRAIETYLRLAYEGPPPAAVRARLEALRGLAPEAFFGCSLFERDNPTEPKRYALRLGNRHYPHMKLIIERRPDGQGHLFRADTHDRHCCPNPGSRDYPAFCELMDRNRAISSAIESEWAEHDLPTFKTYLRDDLAKRAAAKTE